MHSCALRPHGEGIVATIALGISTQLLVLFLYSVHLPCLLFLSVCVSSRYMRCSGNEAVEQLQSSWRGTCCGPGLGRKLAMQQKQQQIQPNKLPTTKTGAKMGTHEPRTSSSRRQSKRSITLLKIARTSLVIVDWRMEGSHSELRRRSERMRRPGYVVCD